MSKMNKIKNDLKPQTNEAGFTMLELIISMVVFLVVTGAVFGLLQVARQSKAVVSENTGLNKNVRLALNLVGRDTYNAGFGYPLRNTVVLPDNRIGTLLSIPNDVDTSRDTVPPIIAGNNITLSLSLIHISRVTGIPYLRKKSSGDCFGWSFDGSDPEYVGGFGHPFAA